MHIFTFKHEDTTVTIMAANLEAAREKLKDEVNNPSDWVYIR
jgi:hypothetical protein